MSIWKRLVKTCLGLVIIAMASVAVQQVAIADGTETLGTPSIPIASGTGVAVAGVGMLDFPDLPNSFDVVVPPGATVRQVLLYWTGHWTDHGPYELHVPQIDGDDSISVNGIPVTGTKIGGSTAFYLQFAGAVDGTEKHVAYRADITSLGLVGAGTNTLTISDMLFESNYPPGFPFNQGNDGAGVVVIYDAPTDTPASITLRDGLDLAYANFLPPLNTTVPQTFTFAPSPEVRTATLATLAASVFARDPWGPRANQLLINFDTGENVVIDNPWQSEQGFEFDAYQTVVTIPANASSMILQAVSGGPEGEPSSLAWIAAALSVPVIPPPLAKIGDFVWQDLNKNGIQDDGEPGIGGVTVRLLDCAGSELGTTTTAASGLYLFDGLQPGGYMVQFGLPAGHAFSPRDQGLDDAVDSDAHPATGLTGCYTLGANETNFTVDAGMYAVQQFQGETATGAGFGWAWTNRAPSNWFMYTPWSSTKINGITKAGISPNGVDLIAGQHYVAGRLTGVRSSTSTTITITLNSGFQFAGASNNVRINPMSCTSNQDYVQPGKFTVATTAPVSNNSITVTGLPNTACYGIHVDVDRTL
jgi:hypothetical protein